MTLEIRLKSFEVSLLRRAMGQVAALAIIHALHVRTQLGLPGRTKLITLLRSPHGNKKARDQFHLCTHKALVVLDAHPQCAHDFVIALSTLRVLGTQMHITTVSDTYAVSSLSDPDPVCDDPECDDPDHPAPQYHSVYHIRGLFTLFTKRFYMPRSLRKGPFVDVSVFHLAPHATVWSRRSMIMPHHVGNTYRVHTGKTFVNVLIQEEMIGHKFGEFASTRKKAIHKKNTKKK